MLRLEDAVVIEECDHPAIVIPVDEVLNVSADLDRSGVGKDVREHVCRERCDSFVFAEQIRNRSKDDRALADFVDGNERFAEGGSDQRLRPFQFQFLIAKHLAVQILRSFAWRKTARVVRFASRACYAQAKEIRRDAFDLCGVEHNRAAGFYVINQPLNPLRRPVDPSTNDDGAIRLKRVNRETRNGEIGSWGRIVFQIAALVCQLLTLDFGLWFLVLARALTNGEALARTLDFVCLGR